LQINEDKMENKTNSIHLGKIESTYAPPLYPTDCEYGRLRI
jgi:hypothetical protein